MVTAAFPKKQGCGDCKTGPKATVKTEVKTPGPAIPDVPVATAGTFKVKKSTHLGPQITRARPQSYDGTFFDGIDMSSVNIVGSGQSPPMPNGNGLSMNGVAPPQMPVHIAPAIPNTYMQDTTQLAFYAASMMNGQTPRTSTANGAGVPFSADNEVARFSLSNGSMMNGNTNYMPNGTFMMNGHMQQPILASPYTTSPAESPSTNGATPATTVKSCCSSKKPSPSIVSSPIDFATHSPQASMQQSYGMSTYNTDNKSLFNNAGMQSATPSYVNSFAPEQQQMRMQDGAWTPNFDMNNYQPQSNPLMHNCPSNFNLPDSAMSSNLAIACGCGTDCECFGCMTHPQNASTFDYIKDLNNQMYMEPQRKSVSISPITPMQQDIFYTLSNQPQAQMFPSHLLYENNLDNNLDNGKRISTTAVKTETPPSSSRTDSPQMSLNGSPFVSGEKQQELDPEDFFFVDYELPSGCGGDEQACECGDDCQCIGCFIHKPEQQRGGIEGETDGGVQTLAHAVELGAGVKIELEGGDAGKSLLLADGTLEERPVKGSCCGNIAA